MKTLTTHRNFRLRLILATILHTPIRITKIRPNDTDPGLRDYEVNFLRILELLTTGSTFEISYTGTTVVYRPGLISGGAHTFTCHPSRGIGYYLEYVLILCFFCKNKMLLVFNGVDGEKHGPGLETLRWGALPVLARFGMRDAELRILKRGAPPAGGASAHFTTNQLLNLPLTIHAVDKPRVTALRGTAYSTRVSPSIVNRLVNSVRGVFGPTGVKTDVLADAWRGEVLGKLPGWGVALVAEGKGDFRVITEEVGGAGEVPEEVGRRAALELLEELSMSGAFCRAQLPLVVTLMVVGKEHVGRVLIGKKQLDAGIVSLLRDVKEIGGGMVHVEGEGDEVVLVVRGVGGINLNRKIA